MADDDRFDNMFLTIAQQAQGIEPLLDVLFSFLRRKTDFFNGASAEKIQEIVMIAIEKQAAIANKVEIEKAVAAEKEKRRKALLEKKKKVRIKIVIIQTSCGDLLSYCSYQFSLNFLHIMQYSS
jgi:hypothetical protein